MTRKNLEARQSCYYEPLVRKKMKFLKTKRKKIEKLGKQNLGEIHAQCFK